MSNKATPTKSYYEQRMADLGVTPENNLISLYDPAEKKEVELPIFREDHNGDIIINYWDIDGHRIVYYIGSSLEPHYWTQRRLQNPEDPSSKYRMPKGQGYYPYIPLELLKLYREKTKVETLFLTEGAFKAHYAARLGVPVMGLPSITCYKNKEGKICHAIRLFIEVCDVQNVVILHDGDCRDISMKAVLESNELTDRPRLFVSQAEKMRQLLTEDIQFSKTRRPPNVFYMHPNRGEIEGDPKGLDDLLVAALAISPERQQKVLQDLADPDRKGRYFFRMDITNTTLRLNSHFGLDSDEPEGFYRLHADKIKSRNFYFHGNLYAYVNAKKKLSLITPEWADGVLWVGNDFYWKKYVPSAREGMSRVRLLPRKKEIIASVLKKRFGKEMVKDFTNYLEYHADFVNLPNHTDYRAVVEHEGTLFYNRYFPFEHEPKQGKCDTILKFVRHIFGEQLVTHPKTGRHTPRYEMGLDYIQLLYQRPVTHLPVLCLYSEENNTGKSTFCKLLNQVFRNNAVFVDNNNLRSEFNAVFADKLLIMCEETSLDRKSDAERIKSLSTADEISINEKNVTQSTIDFFGKFIFCSNYKRMVYVTSHDERFWILRVPVAREKDPNMLDKMVKEIPAFLEFLNQRTMAIPEKEGRMWFRSEMLVTETFLDSVEINEPGIISNIRQGIRDLFDVAAAAGKPIDSISMPMKYIKKYWAGPRDTDKYLAEVLKDYLDVVQSRDAEGKTKSVRGSFLKLETQYTGDGHEDVTMSVKWAGRPYLFPRATFFPEEEVTD